MPRLTDSSRSNGITALSSGVLVLNFVSFIWPRCRRLLRSSRRVMAASKLSALVRQSVINIEVRMDSVCCQWVFFSMVLGQLPQDLSGQEITPIVSYVILKLDKTPHKLVKIIFVLM